MRTGHPHLAPPGWALGRPLAELISEEPLSTAEATAVTLAVLSALGQLHRSGSHHGAVGADAVGIGLDGWIRLSAVGAQEYVSYEEDLAAAGRLLCDLLGLPAEAAGGRTPEAERTAPALVVVGRRLASGNTGWSADDAWAAVQSAAGFRGSDRELEKALQGLGERAAGRSETQRAVTRVILGPPLVSQAAAAPPQRRSRLPDLSHLRLHRGILPALGAMRLPKRELLGREQPAGAALWAGLVLGLVLIGAVAGGLAGTLSNRPTAAHVAAPVHRAPPAQPKPSPRAAQTPDAAVALFFQFVQQQQLDQAALLWRPQLSSKVNLAARFGGVQSIQLARNEILLRDDRLGVATDAVDWVEVDGDGSTHEYTGVIYLAGGTQGWRWDAWKVQEVPQQPSPPPDTGDNG